MAGIITTIDSPNPNETEFEIIIYTRISFINLDVILYVLLGME